MSTIEGGPSASNLIQRARDLILRPAIAWAEIDGEPATIAGLYKSWVLPLAAIPAVCGAIGALAFGSGAFADRPGVAGVAVTAVVGYLLSLASVYVLALIIDALAPSFDGQKNPVQAFKVAAYSSTAVWLAGVFKLFPPLAVLGIVGLYSLYLLYKGLPRLMKVAEDKALTYTAVAVVAAIVISIVVGIVVGVITAPLLAIGMMND